MKSLIATALVTGLWATHAVGLGLASPHDGLPAVVGLGIQRRSVNDAVARDALRKRQQTVSATLANQQTLYYANVSVGTPAQNFKLHIDTGSSDLWVNTPKSQICESRKSPCADSGTYNANSSSTSKYVSSNFNVSYVDGSGSVGDYVTDNVGIGGKTVNGLQFGVGYLSSTPEGILGIGYPSDEGVAQRGGKVYPNLPMAMANGGLIKSTAYSIWLDDLQASSGSILFGGVDSGKYHGTLQALPVQKELNQFVKFIVTLSGLNLSNAGKNTSMSSGLPSPVILDTGSSITYLPDSLAQNIFQALNVQYNAEQGAGFASCNLINQNITVSFVFSSVTINVPISELIINPANADTGNGQFYSNQNQLCLFGISTSQGDTAVLGDTFLRSAYVVFDLANNQVSMAQTNFNSTTTSIQEIGTGTNSVPGTSGVADPVQATVTTNGGSRIGPATSTSTARSGATGAMSIVPYPVLLACLGLLAGAFSSYAKVPVEELSTQGLELGSQQQDLAEQISVQKDNAVKVLENDHEALKTQLLVAFNSRDLTILGVLPQQKRTLWNFLGLDTVPANPVAVACQDVIKQYDLLAKLAMQANKRLNGVYTEFLEIEDELVALAEQLKGLEGKFAEFEGMEEMSDEIQEALEHLTDLEEETETNAETTRINYIVWQEQKRHKQKKARWLWAVAPFTGGLSLPLALRASHQKRVSRRLRDSAASDVRDLRAKIQELKEYQRQLAPHVKIVQDTTKKLEKVRLSAGETTRKNVHLRELVSQQSDQYLDLKEKAMKMVSQTRSLEARVKTLAFAEGADEVKMVFKGLDDDLKQMTLTLISDFSWDD